ncbi:hypothetical protein LTS09_012902 [Friedmanniomyces endolithicus]|nr:hypothetical protein LTS09_012902 [Friedmanniomyces endolithicus]
MHGPHGYAFSVELQSNRSHLLFIGSSDTFYTLAETMPREQYKKDPFPFSADALGYLEGVTVSYRSNSSRTRPLLRYFGGLPYALPPTGPYRFRRPRALPDEYRYGTRANPGRFTRSAAICPQPEVGTKYPEALHDEDCLQLNIYIPTGSPPPNGWPVFFYIHGGYLQWGSANMTPEAVAPLLSDTAFHAIIVMPAYRLNAFGFLASRELQAEAERIGEASGNMGFWDQRAALEWTAKNVRHFGGDVNNITVGGYSAGSHSTFQQLAHELYYVPDDKAVIKRAIMWSNSPGVQPRTVIEHQKQFDEYLTKLKIPLNIPAEEKLKRLRALSATQLVDVQDSMVISEFRATSEGAFIPKDVIANINSGDFARRMQKRGIKLMNGECREEHNSYRSWRTPTSSYEAVYTRLCADYPESAVTKLMDHTCGPNHSLPVAQGDWQDLFGRLYANMQVHCLERGFCNALVKGGMVPGKDLLRYRFDWRAGCVQIPKEWGVTHATDMAIWFWGEGMGEGITEGEGVVLKPWNEAFATFVHGGEVHWPTTTVKEMVRLRDDGKTDVWTDDRWDEGLEVWNLVNGDAKIGMLGWLRSKIYSLGYTYSQDPLINEYIMSGAAHVPGFQHFGAPRSMPPSYQQLPLAQPRPLYFISRDTGILVPLIPADELPFDVRLAGVPRVLRMEDMLGMHHVGMVAYTGMTYTLERDIHTGVKMVEDPTAAMQRSMSQPPPVDLTGGHSRSQGGTSSKYFAPDAHARHSLAQTAAYNSAAYTTSSARPVSAHETATSWRSTYNPSSTSAGTPSTNTRAHPTTTATPSPNPTDPTQSIIDAILATTSGAQEASRLNYIPKSTLPVPPSGTLPDAEKKEYCTHWIRTGECDYTQQGCMYKHEMPDKGTLERIGFRGLPRWWTDRMGVRGRGVGVGGLVGPAEGGRLATVGEVVKSSVWLKRRGGKEEESGSESESERSVAGSVGSKSDEEREVVEVKQPAGPKPRLVPLKPLKMQGAGAHPRSPRVGSTITQKERPATAAVRTDNTAAKRAKPRNFHHQDTIAVETAGITPTRAASPSAADLRKASTSSDLIDLAVPLLPTPSSSSSSPSLTPISSVHSSPRQDQITPRTTSTPATPENLNIVESTDSTTTTKPSPKHVFVPKGESADHHIADALRKKRARQFARRGAPVSAVRVVMPLERQIGEMQRARTAGRKGEEGKVREKGVGLMASRHAPASGKVVMDGGGTMSVVCERKGFAGMGGMRVRRPAGSGMVEGSAKSPKKEG